MDAEITIKNYRCFPDTKPARLLVRDGFTAFIGINNSGKSSLLKFFYELRGLFSALSSANANWTEALRGNPRPFNQASTVVDPDELFHNGNNRGLEIAFRCIINHADHTPPIPHEVTVSVPRTNNTFILQLSTAKGLFQIDNQAGLVAL